MQIGIMRTKNDTIHIRNERGSIKRVPLVTLIVLASGTKLEATTGMKLSKGQPTACQRIRDILDLPRNTTKAKCATYAAELRDVAKGLPIDTVAV